MKSLLKIMLVFASTFVILKATGLITVEKIETWLEFSQAADPIYVTIIIASLLFADLFIAVPTLTVIILGGFFVGPLWGAVAAITGLLLAGCCGYRISYRFGDILMKILLKDEVKREEAKSTFATHGAVVILLSRAVPILPEVSAYMAGMTKMPFPKFFLLWLASAAPYAIIATYAGSVISVDNPLPAILTAIGLSVFFWSGWLIFGNLKNKKTA